MKTNNELRAALNMVLARLDSDPRTAAEWQAIQDALSASLLYSTKCKVMRKRLEELNPRYAASVSTSDLEKDK